MVDPEYENTDESWHDWIFLPGVVDRLRLLDKDGYELAIVTNQRNLSYSGSNQIEFFKRKVESIIRALEVKISIFVAPANGIYERVLITLILKLIIVYK